MTVKIGTVWNIDSFVCGGTVEPTVVCVDMSTSNPRCLPYLRSNEINQSPDIGLVISTPK